MRKPRLIRPVYFLWMFVPVFLYVAVLLFGLPHMVWDYRWRGGAHYGDFAGRHYTFCRYVDDAADEAPDVASTVCLPTTRRTAGVRSCVGITRSLEP